MVFVLERSRVWGTTGRRTTKARRWRSHPVAGGLVKLENRAVAFRGSVTLYDALRPGTWPVLRAPLLTLASARFSWKNARFFAGYARDVARVPLAWTPPARVIFSVDLEDGAILEEGRLVDRWGPWQQNAGASPADVPQAKPLDEAALPEEVRPLLGSTGEGVLGLAGRRGPVVLPAAWAREEGGFRATIDPSLLTLTGAETRSRGGLVVDRASRWRAAEMSGVLIRGEADVTAEAVHLRPDTAVWWRGWASGTVGRP